MHTHTRTHTRNTRATRTHTRYAHTHALRRHTRYADTRATLRYAHIFNSQTGEASLPFDERTSCRCHSSRDECPDNARGGSIRFVPE